MEHKDNVFDNVFRTYLEGKKDPIHYATAVDVYRSLQKRLETGGIDEEQNMAIGFLMKRVEDLERIVEEMRGER